ncbi:gag-pol polyprotein [Tanacetum coccineum]
MCCKFSVSDCSIYDRKTQEVVGTRHREGDLYVLDHFRDIHDSTSSSVDLSSFWLNRSSLPFYLWHSRLGHVSGSSLRFLASTGALEKLDANDISDCSVCKLAKLSALPFGNSVSSSNSPFDLVHSDVWGPSPVYTKGEFRALVKTQHSTVIKCFRNDLGREYTSNEFFGLLKSDGTIYQSSCTDTTQQNSVAERKHRHLVETARSFLLAADVPNVFWGEAVLTAAYVINRIPTAHNSGLSLFEKLYGILPDYSSLCVFGCTCFVLKPHVERFCNFLTKNTQEALTIIENKSKVQTSRNKPQVSSASGSSTQDAAITALTKQVEALVSSMNRPINSIQNGCETCGGPHAYYECQAAGGYSQEDVYATTGTYNAGGNSYQPQGNRNMLSYRSNNYLRPPGFNNQNQRNNQGYNQGNNQGNNQAYQNNQNRNTQNQNHNRYNQGTQNQGFNQNRGQNYNQGNNYNQNQGYNHNQAQPHVPSLEEMMFQHMRMNEAKMQQRQDYNNQQMQ